MQARSGLVLTALAAFLLTLAGCGGAGGGTGARGGGFRLTIKWPSATRQIPYLTTRIHLKVDRDGVVLPQTDIDVAKPTNGATVSTVTFADLPTGVSLNFHAEAFGKRSETETETLLGIVQNTVSLTEGMDNVVVMELASTIHHLRISSADLEDGKVTIEPKKQSQLNVTAFSDAGETAMVPLAPALLEYTGTGAGFTVSQAGVLNGSAFGAGKVTVRDRDSGKSAEIDVSVKSAVRSLVIGTGGAFDIVNRQPDLQLLPLIKALDKNGQPVTGAKFTLSVSGAGLTLNSTASTLGADKGTLIEDALNAGTLTVAVQDSDLTGQAAINVRSHGAITKFFLIQDNLPMSKISIPFITSTAALSLNGPFDGSDYELHASDKYNNPVILDNEDLEWSVPPRDAALYSITLTNFGIILTDVMNGSGTSSLRIKDVHSGYTQSIPIING